MPQPNPPTPKQNQARDRNWYIVRLRSLWIQVSLVRNPIAVKAMREAIDEELAALGAETETARTVRVREMISKGRYDDLDRHYKKVQFNRSKLGKRDNFPF